MGYFSTALYPALHPYTHLHIWHAYRPRDRGADAGSTVDREARRQVEPEARRRRVAELAVPVTRGCLGHSLTTRQTNSSLVCSSCQQRR